jgi:hypothetical protein
MISQETKDAVLEAQVTAALQGHDIGPFEPVDTQIGGWQAECRQCGQGVWVGEAGLIYSLLEDSCQKLLLS